MNKSIRIKVEKKINLPVEHDDVSVCELYCSCTAHGVECSPVAVLRCCIKYILHILKYANMAAILSKHNAPSTSRVIKNFGGPR